MINKYWDLSKFSWEVKTAAREVYGTEPPIFPEYPYYR